MHSPAAPTSDHGPAKESGATGPPAPSFQEGGLKECGFAGPAKRTQKAGECGAVGSTASFEADAAQRAAPHSSQTPHSSPAPLILQPLDKSQAIEKTRQFLPHWTQSGCTYFVTYRLADSFPQSVLREWQAEMEVWLKFNPKPWDDIAQREYNKRFEGLRQKWLDAGHGSCVLRDPALRTIVAKGFHHFDGQRYDLGDYVIMPNHVHVLVTPGPGWELSRILHTWKSYSGHEILKRTRGEPPFWLQESFDHAVRSERQLNHYRNYIRENPEKAKLWPGKFTHWELPACADKECGSAGSAELKKENAAQRAAPHSFPALVLTALLSLLALIAPLHADSIGESADFSVDTRDYGGSEVAESADFTVDTTTNSGIGPVEGGLFTVDTRAPSPDLASAEGEVFTVDTRPYTNAPPLVLSGKVTSFLGAVIGDASVTLQLYGSPQAEVVTLNNGTYQTPPLPPRSYTVVLSAPGWRPQLRNLTDGWRGGAQSLDFQLQLDPVWLTQFSNGRQPTAGEAPRCDAGTGAYLKLLTAWPDKASRATVILTHGWLVNADGWPSEMGQRIKDNASGMAPNVVAWDWRQPAARIAPIPIVEAACQGPKLGAALQSLLGTNYSQPVHFIGHSLGTIVNSRACDYLHGGGPSRFQKAAVLWNHLLTQPHVTLLDEAEIANPLGSNVIGGSELSARIALARTLAPTGSGTAVLTALDSLRVTLRDWKSPLPARASWTDNYISLVGWTHETAVNTCLFATPEQLGQIIPAHSYAWQWYRDSVTQGAASPLGWHRSLESGAAFPPSSTYPAGSLWLQSVGPNRNPMNLTLVPQLTPWDCAIYQTDAVVVSWAMNTARVAGTASYAAYQALDATGRAILNTYQAGINYAGDLGGTAIFRTGQVLTSVKAKIGHGIDAGIDRLARWGVSVVPGLELTENLFITTPVICLLAPNRNLRGGNNDAPSAWVTLKIPPDAGLMAFDFTVNGDPADDAIACAVAGTNLFNLPASFVEEGETQSTDYMDVSQWAGQTVEIFLGLTGGTSSSCELLVDSLRFVTIPLPPLVIEDHGATVSLHWPTAASGWLLEATDSLAAGSWQEVLPNPGALTAADGITRLEEAKSPQRQFYRLHRKSSPP